jgi:hypothetical protein
MYRRDEGHTVVSFIYSEEGTRAGCRLGSFIFDMVFQPIYEAGEEAFPGSVTVPHTDDKSTVVPPPVNGDYNCRLKQLHEVGHLCDSMANKIGVFLNSEKSVFLLPPSVPPDTETLKMFPNHTVTYDGFILMGRPVGTDKYISYKSGNKSKSVTARVQIIRKFVQKVPCITIKLLVMSTNHGMDYITRTVPPRLLTVTVSIFDSAMFDTVIGILSSSGAVFPRTERSCLERTKRLVHLPYRHGGLDLIKLTHKSPVTYYGCSLQIAGDPNILE